MLSPWPSAARLCGTCVAGLLFVCSHPASGAIRTVPKGSGGASQNVREAIKAPTEQGRVEGLIRVLNGSDLPAAMEAMEFLASLGPAVVPRLVSEMRNSRNNWLIGGALSKMGAPAVEPILELLEQADASTTVDCIYLLGEIQDRRAISTLVRYLEDPREKVRMYSVTALLRIGGPRSVEAVLSRLTREGKGLEGFILEALLRYGQKSLEPVLQNLKSHNPKVRKEAAYLLGGLGDVRAVEALISTLQDPDPAVRQNAVYALGTLTGTISEPKVVIDALSKLLSDPDEKVVSAARKGLVGFGDRSVKVLIQACSRGSIDEILAALNGLREIGSPEAEGLMVQFLKHPDRRVRVLAVAGLITVGTGKSVEPLLDALRDEDLRWFATLALEKLGPANPALFFSTSADDPTMSLRIQILAHVGPRVVPVLLEHLRGDNVGRKAAVLWVLGEIGDETCALEAAKLLGDSELGWLAGRALRRMGDAGLKALLRTALSPSSDGCAIQALEALALFDDPRAWGALEEAVERPLPRVARVRSAVLLSLKGDPVQVERLRSYLDGAGRDLWPEVRTALQAERQIR